MATRSEARKARWAAMTPEEKSALQRKIAESRYAKLTPEQRRAITKKASAARWPKKKKR